MKFNRLGPTKCNNSTYKDTVAIFATYLKTTSFPSLFPTAKSLFSTDEDWQYILE